MDEEITPTETPTPDITNYIDGQMVEVVSDNRTLMGTMLHYVFGNVDVMVFIVSIMMLATVLIITTDFMRWKGRE